MDYLHLRTQVTLSQELQSVQLRTTQLQKKEIIIQIPDRATQLSPEVVTPFTFTSLRAPSTTLKDDSSLK